MPRVHAIHPVDGTAPDPATCTAKTPEADAPRDVNLSLVRCRCRFVSSAVQKTSAPLCLTLEHVLYAASCALDFRTQIPQLPSPAGAGAPAAPNFPHIWGIFFRLFFFLKYRRVAPYSHDEAHVTFSSSIVMKTSSGRHACFKQCI